MAAVSARKIAALTSGDFAADLQLQTLRRIKADGVERLRHRETTVIGQQEGGILWIQTDISTIVIRKNDGGVIGS